jgi:hypothetical protein
VGEEKRKENKMKGKGIHGSCKRERKERKERERRR